MTKLKRPVDIVLSAAQTLSAHPNLLYLFVGEGDRREELMTLSEQLGIRERMRFERFVDYGLMPAYLNLADLVVVASESEGLARMYLEAQACAKTLVCSDIPAAREVIAHGQTGLLFRKGDTADLAEKTLLAAGDAVLRAEIGRRSLAQVKANGMDEIARAYLKLIERLLAEPIRAHK
jgi:glycosyltransferase involved in cell wall biosynthesis